MRARLTGIAIAGFTALQLCPGGLRAQSSIGPEVYVARPTGDVSGQAPLQKVGTTKRVSVELHRSDQNFRVQITALEGNQFAVRPVRQDERGDARVAIQDTRGETVSMVAPAFLSGDSDIAIRVDPALGFTEFVGLKIFDPTTVSIALDGVIESDRVGVRAVAFDGLVRYADCFLAVSKTTDAAGQQVFDIGSFLKAPAAPDGSMQRKAGESLDCSVSLSGSDGTRYVSEARDVGGKARIVFVQR